MAYLSNDYCNIEYRDEVKEFFGRDLTDNWNDPAFYNRTKRSYRKAKEALIASFTEKTTMNDVMTLMRGNGIRCHYWCMVD